MPGDKKNTFFLDKLALSFLSKGYSLSQWLNFKLSGITCLVGKMSSFNGFFDGPGRLREVWHFPVFGGHFTHMCDEIRRPCGATMTMPRVELSARVAALVMVLTMSPSD